MTPAVCFPGLAHVRATRVNDAGTDQRHQGVIQEKPDRALAAGSTSVPQRTAATRSWLLAKSGPVVLWGVLSFSFLDYIAFAYFVHNQGTATFNDAQAQAITEISTSVASSGTGLVLPDPCIDPFRLKVLTGVPTAYYNLGLAWPSHEPSFRALLEKRDSGSLDQPLAELAGVQYVMIDSACERSWQGQVEGAKVAEKHYGEGSVGATVTLWKIGS